LTLELLGQSADWAAGAVQLTIEDDGRGCDPVESRAAGAGLSGIHERIAMFGGCMAMCSEASGGTRLSVTIPAGRAAQEAA